MTTKIFCALLFIFVLSCTRKQHPVEPIDPTPYVPIIELGQVTVFKNNTAWDIPFEAKYYKSDSTFELKAVKVTGNILENFRIADIPLVTAQYPLQYVKIAGELIDNKPQAVLSYFVDFDQGADTYYLDTLRHDHFIEVIRFDTVTNAVEGRFQIFLRKRPIAVGLGLPDTMALTDGRFHLVVEEP